MMPRRRHHFLLAAGILSLAVAIPSARAEISPMTRARIPEAQEAARHAVKDEQIVHAGTCRTKGMRLPHMFEVIVTTPFGAVALAAFQARTTDRDLDLGLWPIDPPADQRVIVSVDPAALQPAGLPQAEPLSVRSVRLRRGGAIVEAVRSDTHEVHFPNLDEAHRTRRGGAFYFPLEPFASRAGDLEIVIVPDGGEDGAEAVLTIKAALLAKLK